MTATCQQGNVEQVYIKSNYGTVMSIVMYTVLFWTQKSVGYSNMLETV